ncbi:vertnin-like [Acipenser ruthenus]|uniref:vertnin-like n=1 Tax=Acipenser ruthenus TaxID=7906 RepID=UPI0027404B93|nr:vertnin-like [Acipenser ruthenus]XP_058844022.1 vertnin-like [Acipenser ruthenus]
MIQRREVVQSVLRELQDATECVGLGRLVRAALVVEHALSSFLLPGTCNEGHPAGADIDSTARCLYPQDAPAHMVPLACKGDGNLLFDAASMLLVGNTSLSLELQVRTVVELLLRKRYYLHGMIDSKVMLQAARFSLCTEESAEQMNLSMAVLEAIFDADVKATCFPGTFANMWHVYALASVIQCNIYSIYPMRNLKIRPYFNRLIRPRTWPQGSELMTLHIMWSGELESETVFKPQHFVPVMRTKDAQMGSPDDEHHALPLKTLELLNQDPQLSYSSLKDRYNITKSTFYRWKRQTQEHRKKAAARYEAKHFLQMCFAEGKLLPLNQFKEFFPEISRSTYYAWKHELLQAGSGGDTFMITKKQEVGGNGDVLEQEGWLPPERHLQNYYGSVPVANVPISPNNERLVGDRAQNFAFMQEAKKCLQNCIATNALLPYRNFKKSFPGISRSTYYNWRREAIMANPGFKDTFGSSEDSLDAERSPLAEAQCPVKMEALVRFAKVTRGERHKKSFYSSFERRKKLREEAKRWVQKWGLAFSHFKVKYPTISSSSFWFWKKTVAVKKAEKAFNWDADWSKSSVSTRPVLSEQTTLESELVPSFEKSNEHLDKRPFSPYNATISAYTVSDKSMDDQVFVMDVVALANFKAKAKLFLQQRFEEKSFPTFKEFRSYFPLTPRSTYYMWKRALHHGLTLVHG